MHGRLKVKTTAQQEAEKKAQREEKLKTYQTAMAAIFAARKSIKESEENAPEKIKMQLKMTAGVLMSNPDISTLWNIRKELLEIILKEAPGDEHDVVLRKELDLTVQCLQSNPKSYGAWHHRCWSMLNMKVPKWDYELSLCDKYLSMDERNFHCWDYRRFVVKNAQISAQSELDYSMERIKVNFSNYSAWHYRSKLLPLTDPGEKGQTINEAKKREELDLVLNAAFTDPEDSSAWFYHKWLLGRADQVFARPTLALHKDGKFSVGFSKCISANEIKVVNGNNQEEIIGVNWQSVTNQSYDSLWFTASELPASVSIRVQMANGQSSQSLEVHGNEICQAQRIENFDEATLKVLEDELSNCNELLELEPDSKWTLYTKVLIMKTMDAERFHEDIVKGLDMLCHIDAKRQGYYQDQKSKCILDVAFARQIRTNAGGGAHLNLSGLGLTSLYFKERFAFFQRIDLSGNHLKCVQSLVPYLQRCTEIVLDENSKSSTAALKLCDSRIKIVSS